MRGILPTLAVIVQAAPPAAGQSPGDSFRLRLAPPSQWTHGRLVS